MENLIGALALHGRIGLIAPDALKYSDLKRERERERQRETERDRERDRERERERERERVTTLPAPGF